MKGSGPFEVVAFLEVQVQDKWRLVFGTAGIVGFKQQDVFLMTDDESESSDFQLSPDYTRATFLADLDATLRTVAQPTRCSPRPAPARIFAPSLPSR